MEVLEEYQRRIEELEECLAEKDARIARRDGRIKDLTDRRRTEPRGEGDCCDHESLQKALAASRAKELALREKSTNLEKRMLSQAETIKTCREECRLNEQEKRRLQESIEGKDVENEKVRLFLSFEVRQAHEQFLIAGQSLTTTGS